MDILEIEGGIVGTTEGILEEHGDEGRSGAGGETIVSGDLRANMGTTN